MRYEYTNVLVEVGGIRTSEFIKNYTKVDKVCLKKFKIYFCLNNRYTESKSSKSKRHVGIVTDIIVPKDKSENIKINVYTIEPMESILRNSTVFVNRTANEFLYFYINSPRIFNIELKNLEMEAIKDSMIKKAKGEVDEQ